MNPKEKLPIKHPVFIAITDEIAALRFAMHAPSLQNEPTTAGLCKRAPMYYFLRVG